MAHTNLTVAKALLSKQIGKPYTSLRLGTIEEKTKARKAKEIEELKELNKVMHEASDTERLKPRKVEKDHLSQITGAKEPLHPGMVQYVSRYQGARNWTELRKQFVLGKRKQLNDGTYVSEDYRYREFCDKYDITYSGFKYHFSKERWGELRKAYLTRVNQKNIGLELGLYVQENYQAEVAAMTASNKLGVVLDRYIEHRFGEILDAVEDIDNYDYLSEDIKEQMDRVNYKTGTPMFLTEVKEAINVAASIYKLQRTIYDNAPKEDSEIFESITTKPKFKSQQDREQTIKKLEAALGRKLNAHEQKKVEDKANASQNQLAIMANAIPIEQVTVTLPAKATLPEPKQYQVDVVM